jgi:hypothetical protein
VRAQVHVADVAQQPAPGAIDELVQELHFSHRGAREPDVAGRIFEKKRSPQTVLNLGELVGHDSQSLRVIGQRKKVVQSPGASTTQMPDTDGIHTRSQHAPSRDGVDRFQARHRRPRY